MSFVLFHTHLVACSYSIYSDVHKHNTPLAEYHTRIGLHYKLTCYISSSVTVQYVSLRHCCMQKNQTKPSSYFEFGRLGRGLFLDTTHFDWSEKSSKEKVSLSQNITRNARIEQSLTIPFGVLRGGWIYRLMQQNNKSRMFVRYIQIDSKSNVLELSIFRVRCTCYFSHDRFWLIFVGIFFKGM